MALSSRVGYLRIWTFDVDDDTAFVDEVARVVGLLPQTGLVVDLRGNPGGLDLGRGAHAAAVHRRGRSRRHASPLLATPLMRKLAASPFNRMELEAWSPSLEDSMSTGDLWSQPLPLTDPAWCNDKGRTYPGPAVAVVDPNTYSSGDLFAAGWVDHEHRAAGQRRPRHRRRRRERVDRRTSSATRFAGTDHQLRVMPEGRRLHPRLPPGHPLRPPATASRSRTSGSSGIPYAMTRRDLLDGNKDLLAFCTSRQLAPEETTHAHLPFDPGPSIPVYHHLASLPSYEPHKTKFWYDWGPIFYRGRLDRSARLLCIASDPGPTERIAGRTPGRRRRPAGAGLPDQDRADPQLPLHQRVLVRALPVRPPAAPRPMLHEPEHVAWRNTLSR